MSDSPPKRLNPFYRMTIIASGLFVLTIFAMIASALGGSSGSAFDENTGMILTVEVLAILGSVCAAIASDSPGTENSDPTATAPDNDRRNDDDRGDSPAD